jgi:hypothetical protein
MCNFLEASSGIWSKPGTFAAAVSAAQNFGQGTAMMNYAKAQSLSKKPQTVGYVAVPDPGALANNRIYRCWLWVGPVATPVPAANSVNHEIMIVTGTGNDIAYFEPNFGFFQPTNIGMNNRQAMEHFVNDLYGHPVAPSPPLKAAPTMHAGNFGYFNVRGIGSATPTSF